MVGMRESISGGPVWEITSQSNRERREGSHDSWGTWVEDIDGTLTVPGKKYAIDSKVIEINGEFLIRGGNLIFNSGANLYRTERNVLSPLYFSLDQAVGQPRVDVLFQHVFVMPENGSALLLNKAVYIRENLLAFDWFKLHELHVPDKVLLRRAIETDLVPLFKSSLIAGDYSTDLMKRDYILSWSGVPDTRGLVKYIQETVIPKHPEINWGKIALKPARTTVDFVHADSGKTISVRWVLDELAGLDGPVVGFGDLGDEFAKVVATFNVNKLKPNEFRISGIPAMDVAGRWVILNPGEYVMVGKGSKAKVESRDTGEEIQVLRDEAGMIIFTEEVNKSFTDPHGDIIREETYLSPLFKGNEYNDEEGRPVRIEPLTYKKNGKILEVQDAGDATAWIMRRLLDIGYFNIR